MSDKPIGRPREFDGTPVSVRLPATLHDALSRVAIHQQRDLSDVIRAGLAAFVSQKAGSVENTSE